MQDDPQNPGSGLGSNTKLGGFDHGPKRPDAGPWPWPAHRAPPYDIEAPTGGGGDGSTMQTVIELLTVMRRRWPIVLATVGLALAIGALIVTLLPRQWRGEASLLLHPSGPEVLDTVEGVEERLDRNGYGQYYQTQRQVISSRTVAAAALAELGLADDPVFLGIGDLSKAERADAMKDIDPVERLRELIEVREVHDSRVLNIRIEYPDAETAADIANAVADAYLEYVTGERETSGVRATDDLGRELETARDTLREAEKALADFKSKHEITTIALEDRQSDITNEIIELGHLVQSAQAERISAEDLFAEAKKLHKKGAYSGVASMLGAGERRVFDELVPSQVEAQAEYQAADLRYGDKHPTWVEAKQRKQLLNKAIAREAEGHIGTFEARYHAAAATERKLKAELSRARKHALTLSKLEPEYKELARNVADAEEIYQVLSRRAAEVGLTNRVEGRPPVEVLDYATVATKPVRPRVGLSMAAALLVGLVFGGLAAVAVDLRDVRIRDLRDLERTVSGWDLPVLGQLPTLPLDPELGGGNLRDQRRQRDLYTHRFPQSAMAERIRSLRAAVGFALGQQDQPVIMVTSPASAEGKSSIALNLALSWCQANKSVVLIDADLRRPRLHEVFPIPPDHEGVGLVSVLNGDATLDDALIAAPDGAPESLSVLPCGPQPETPAELLDSHVFRKTLTQLRARFDVVVLDTPPLLPVVDALLLARIADGVVLVSRSRTSSRAEIHRSLTLLRQRDTNLLGLVLNDVGLRASGGYYGYEPYGTYGRKDH